MFRAGERVVIRSSYDGRWIGGFEVTRSVPEGYRVRRLSDGRELPMTFPDDRLSPQALGNQPGPSGP